MILQISHFFQQHKAYFLLIGVLATVYWISIPFKPYTGSFIVKWLPIGLLTSLTWRYRQHAHVRWLFLALIFHGLGDIIIDFDGKQTLLMAIFPFMMGLLLYACVFQKDARHVSELTTWEKFILTFIVMYGVSFGILLSSKLSFPFLMAVSIYIIVILSLVILSLLARYHKKTVFFGALLHVLSDSLIALDAFIVPFSWSLLVTWPTYMLGQVFIIAGYLSEKTKSFDN